MGKELNSDEEIKIALRDNHLKITRSRIAVYKILLNSKKPLSHSDIMEALDDGKNFDRVTIYRTLGEFEEKKIVKSLLSGERTSYFEIICPLQEQHAHITCESCGKIECLHDNHFDFSIKQTGDYQINSVDILVRGLCGKCK